MMWWPFRPKHTVDSVAKEILEGLDNGSVVLPWSDAELDALERDIAEPLFVPPPVAEGPFLQYSTPPVTGATVRKKRVDSEAVRVSGVLVDSRSRNGEVPGYATV